MYRRIIFCAIVIFTGYIKAMDEKPILGRMIVYPNQAFTMETDTHRNSRSGPNIANIENAFGISIRPGMRLVRVHVAGSGVGDWHSNVHSLFSRVQLIGQNGVIVDARSIKFPAWIPELYVNTLREGETITFTVHDKKVTLTAAQTQSCYKRMGKFEDVMREKLSVEPGEKPSHQYHKKSYSGWWPLYGIGVTTLAAGVYVAYTNKLSSWLSTGKSFCMNSWNWFSNKRK